MSIVKDISSPTFRPALRAINGNFLTNIISGDLSNGNFEDTLNGWTVTGGVSHDIVDFYDGAGSAKLTITAGGAQNIRQSVLEVGELYRAEVWVKVSDDTKNFRIDFGTGNLNTISTAGKGVGWNRYTAEGTATSSSDFRIFRSSSSGDYTINVDAVKLQKVTT